MAWSSLERTAKQVTAVTNPQQTLYADEAIYFLTRRAPPSGMEMENSHKFLLPPEMLSLLHLIPQAELDRRVKAGDFSTLETCDEHEEVEEHGYAKLYAKSAAVGACTVFWDKIPGNK
jgi:hypothetical protein